VILAASYQPISKHLWPFAKASEDRPVTVENSASQVEIQLERRLSLPRRQEGNERRKACAPVVEERRVAERRNTQRRRQIDPTTCEREYSDDEIQFMRALDEYKRTSGRMFPTCSEILEVIRALGYVKQADGGAVEESVA
jgi:hypothetical protein